MKTVRELLLELEALPGVEIEIITIPPSFMRKTEERAMVEDEMLLDFEGREYHALNDQP